MLTDVFAMEAIGGAKGLVEGNPCEVMTQIEGILATVPYRGAIPNGTRSNERSSPSK